MGRIGIVTSTVAALLVGTTISSKAQVNVTFLSFGGAGVILDNPPSPSCVSANSDYVYGYGFVVEYRYTLKPSSTVADSISFVHQFRITRITSTQSPTFSLDGPSTANWDGISGRPNYVTLTGSSSSLKIIGDFGFPVTLFTEDIRMIGTINDFD
jgi:hypothetical protein